MKLLARVRSWVRAVSRRTRFEREMDDELRFHVDQYADDLVREGVPAHEARRRARAEFGAIEARINWKPDSFAVTFYVERESTRAIVEAGLNELSAELSASGFSAVTMNVWLNPDRVSAGVTAGATPVRPALRAGTILDVMA